MTRQPGKCRGNRLRAGFAGGSSPTLLPKPQRGKGGDGSGRALCVCVCVAPPSPGERTTNPLSPNLRGCSLIPSFTPLPPHAQATNLVAVFWKSFTMVSSLHCLLHHIHCGLSSPLGYLLEMLLLLNFWLSCGRIVNCVSLTVRFSARVGLI